MVAQKVKIMGIANPRILFFMLFSFLLVGGAIVLLQNAVLSSTINYPGSYAGAVVATTAEIDPQLGVVKETLEFPLASQAPKGCTVIIIEDDAVAAGFLGGVMVAGGCTPVAYYADCPGYRAGAIKTATVIVVDLESKFSGEKGYFCVQLMYSQVPPPLLIIGYTSEVNKASQFLTNGANGVFDKRTTSQVQLVEKIVEMLLK